MHNASMQRNCGLNQRMFKFLTFLGRGKYEAVLSPTRGILLLSGQLWPSILAEVSVSPAKSYQGSDIG